MTDVWELVEWVDENSTPVYVRVETLAVVACWLLVAAWAWWVFRR